VGNPQPRGQEGWKDLIALGLPKVLKEEWNYISLLCEKFISLDEEIEDSLCLSKNSKDKTFTKKKGYKS
jgi:hypothetical protein